jgi:hypothetical protein
MERNYKIALIAGIVIAALAILWYASKAAYAQPAFVPKCIPAYTLDPKNDVGGQLFSATFLPMFLIVGVPVIQDKNDNLDPLTQARAFCTVAAVAKHAAGLKEYTPEDRR